MAELVADLPPHVAALWIAGAIAYGIFAHSPLLFSGLVAIRRGRNMRRRILFIGTVMIVAYGVFFMTVAILCVPVGAFVIFFVPALISMGQMQASSSFLAAMDLVVDYWWLFVPPAFAVLSFFVTRHVSRRWNDIAGALDGPATAGAPSTRSGASQVPTQ